MLVKVRNEKGCLLIEVLAKEIWSEYYTPIIGKNQIAYMLEKFQSKETIINQIKNKQFSYYIIKENNEPVGYIAVQLKKEGLFLSKFYVKSLQRGKGHGRQVMNFIEKLAKEKDLTKILLTVNKNNSNSIKAYERMGFQKVDSVIQDIGCGYVMDDYKMVKSL